MCNLLKKRIVNKKINFNISYADDLPKLLIGDKGKIKEIITNLITNSIKYTDEGKIDFNIKCINNKEICKLIISVSYTGRGIRKEMMSKLFQKFSRDNEVMNTTIEGVGLGLAITKNLVELMGGTITVNSTIGIGSIFTVTFLQKIVTPQQKVSEELNKEKLEEIMMDNQNVLIVDDNALNLKIEKSHLEHFGIIADTCNSGEECLNKILSDKKYDVILMDDMMPGISGTDTMIKLKNSYNCNIPILVITANATEEAKIQYLEKGFDEFIAKPVSREDLYEIVKKYL